MSKSSMTLPQLYKYFSHSKWDLHFILLLLTFDSILSLAIVKYVPYTEIDWKAYMQEVTMWQNGENDYSKIYGDTGPLVYPAGFLYIFALLKWLTNGGDNLMLGQYIFCGIYVFHAAIVLTIYDIVMREQTASMQKREMNGSLLSCHKVWMWRITMVLTCMSKRIHSIFVLRLFNDGPCMTLFYISALLMARSHWRVGCVFFSLAVSVKMNILLFAPGLLLLLLQSSENTAEVVLCLGICGGIQLILGAPFLISHPISYLRKAFEFDRVFFYKWTVNWKVRIFGFGVMSFL
jgi:ALG3 protein.